jgi:hypothetical protein
MDGDCYINCLVTKDGEQTMSIQIWQININQKVQESRSDYDRIYIPSGRKRKI